MSSRLQERVSVTTGTSGSMSRASAPALTTDGALAAGRELRVDAAQGTVEPVCGGVGEMVSEDWCYLTDPADRRALVALALANFDPVQDISDDDWARTPRNEVDLLPRADE